MDRNDATLGAAPPARLNAEARRWFPRAGFFVSIVMVGAAGFEPTTPSPPDRIEFIYFNVVFHNIGAF